MTEQSENKELLYKILLLGDSSVGKTCFLMRYTDNTYQEIHMSTIGIDNKFKDVELEDGKKVKIQIWDTAGQDRFRSITRNYYKGANGIVLIFDVTNKKSYENVKNWVKQIKEEVSSRVTIILVANKIDDVNHRIVTKEEGEKIANECGLMFFECSAKTGENIEHAFNELVKKTVENYSKVGQGGEKLKKKKNSKKGCC
jgi:small GTP-binding protein